MGEQGTFERILASLHEAMLDDVRWPETSGLILAVPIIILSMVLVGNALDWTQESVGLEIWAALLSAFGYVFLPALLMIVFRRKYPRWWFDWNLELARFTTRVNAYLCCCVTSTPRPTSSRPPTSTSTTSTPRGTSTAGSRWSSGCSRSRTTSRGYRSG